MLNVIMLNVITLNAIMLNVIMLSVVMTTVITLNAIMPNVIIFSVMAPVKKFAGHKHSSLFRRFIKVLHHLIQLRAQCYKTFLSVNYGFL